MENTSAESTVARWPHAPDIDPGGLLPNKE